MSKVHKYLLVGVILFSGVHLIRDVLQEFGVNILLTEILNKTDASKVPGWYWVIPNSITLTTLAIILAGLALYKKSFGPYGVTAVALLVVFLVAWIIYWLAF